MGLGDALSVILLIDKFRAKGEGKILRQFPFDYLEKIILQIPQSLRKLLSDVIRVLLDNSGFEQDDIEKITEHVENPEGKEKGRMFEQVVESIKEARKEILNEAVNEAVEKAVNEAVNEARKEWKQDMVKVLKSGKAREEIIMEYEEKGT